MRWERRVIGFDFRRGYNGIIKAGNSGTPLEIKTTPLLALYSTTTATTGALKTMLVQQTHTVASTAHNIEVFKAQLASAVKTGSWVNAIFGRVAYTAPGFAYGSASAVCGEIAFPASALSNGTYSVFQAEVDTGSCTQLGAEASIFDINIWGTNTTEWDDNGYLFSITGLASTSGGFWYDNTSGTTDGYLKIRINGATRYLQVAENQS